MADQGALFVPRRVGEAVVGYDSPAEVARPRDLPRPRELVRSSDPSSSHEAALEAVRSGRVGSHYDVLEALFDVHPWVTTLELWHLEPDAFRRAKLDRVAIARRPAQMVRMRRLVRMDPDANAGLAPCRRSHLANHRCYRWARPEHIDRCWDVLAPATETAYIDRGDQVVEVRRRAA